MLHGDSLLPPAPDSRPTIGRIVVTVRIPVNGSRTAGDAFVRLGVLALTFAIFALVTVQGLTHMIVHFMVHGIDRGHSEATLLSHAVDIQAVQGELRIIAGLTNAL